ncbi:hypothetical protein Tco_0268938 [Tanacetum coccineum]
MMNLQLCHYPFGIMLWRNYATALLNMVPTNKVDNDTIMNLMIPKGNNRVGLNKGNSFCEKEKTMDKLLIAETRRKAEQTAIERATAQFRPQTLAVA